MDMDIDIDIDIDTGTDICVGLDVNTDTDLNTIAVKCIYQSTCSTSSSRGMRRISLSWNSGRLVCLLFENK